MMKQLIVTGLTKTFGQGDNIVHALLDVNLSVEKGDFLAIMGASGSGKSSILRLINGLIPHFHSAECEGEITLGDTAVHTLPLAKIGQRCATVLQNPRTQFFTTSVSAELAFAGQNF